MRKIFGVMLLALMAHVSTYAQKDSIQSRIIVIGDAGKLTGGTHPIVSAVRKKIKLDSLTTILYMGDNLYTYGLPDDAFPGYSGGTAVLDSQINIAGNSAAKVLFIPGNHDWNHEGPDGWNSVVREQQYIDRYSGKRVHFYPKDGCPGPTEIEITKEITLVIMDTQWWLHPYDKPGIESDCPYKTKEEVLNQLDDIINRNSKKLVLLAGHHPFKSNGIHGGYFTLKQHLFPLTDIKPKMYVPIPVIGSIYPITRGVFGTLQDLKHPSYQNMVNAIQKVARQHPNLLFLAGHEHNLQLIKDSSYHYIVSGSGSGTTRVSKSKKLLYGAEENGFAEITVSNNKNVNLKFYTVKGDAVDEAYNTDILNFSKLPKKEVASETQTSQPTAVFKDSVVVAINTNFAKANKLKRWILGNNYRKEWATPVHLKVFDLRKEKGGFTIESLGGGKQTTSLRLKDKKGKEWTLRSVNKNPEKAVPENLRGSIAQDIVQDMISASHPYAALAIPKMSEAVEVVTPAPTFYFVPDDPAFGIYRSRVANSVFLLEEREPTVDATDTKSTPKVINKIYEDNDDRIDQPQVLRARLLDMVIGDWDRHFDQWRWGTRDTGKGKVYYAVPRDRDQAFFNSDGKLVKFISKNLFPYLKGFNKGIDNVNWYNWEEKDFDRIFLNRLDRNAWASIIDTFQHKLTDSIIREAVKQMPPEIFAIDGEQMIDILKHRRDTLSTQAMKYYEFLSREVKVVGTNEREVFDVTAKGDSLQVKVFKRKKENQRDTTVLMYQRYFDANTTKEIHLYGLNNDDEFKIDPNAQSKILVRMIGGKGSDTFHIQGNVPNRLYDLDSGATHISSSNRSRILTSNDPHVNDFSPVGYQYDIWRFPRINIGINGEDGLMAGIGFMKRTFGFRKEPFSTEQRFSTLFALNRGSYRLKYQGIFNHVIGKTDLLVNADMANPVLNNFYGFGNETVFDPSKGVPFYQVRYKYLETSVLFRKRFNSLFHVSVGPTFFHYWDRFENNEGKILGKPSLVGLDSNSVYALKTYLGGKANIWINNLDNVLLPTRGIQWNTEFTSLGTLSKASKPFTSITSDMVVHAALTDPAKFVVVVRAGAGHIFSKNFEYFQALNLGANNYLRGFRKDRFSGRSLVYSGLEMRVKLFESKSYVFPGAFGVIGFSETGRVWFDEETSKKWHHSYGGGLYYAAYNFVLISATMSYSREESLFNLSIGTKFNLTF